MNHPPDREETIFEAALQLPPEQRAAHLQQACGEDAPLRQRVELLLKSHEQASGDFLEKPHALGPKKTMVVSPPPPIEELLGTMIGRYKLLEKVGEGGFGVVYVAEQREPVKRRVALKIIKLGMDTRQVVARFEVERQALALMDHPNIAKVFDAGATETGRPYFVMELVRGIRITDYCNQNHLATRERLELFAKVCQAIQHAHQKGVIHRDIKPSNLLVTLHDGVPVPKVIDFGIAKATQGELSEHTVYTQLQQFIGTPAYMSPEQAEMSGLDIDTRSDIYALGVLLYELLTGKTPLDQKDLLSAGLDGMRRMIREQEPQRPSTRVSSLQGEDRTTTAKRHSLDAPKLAHLLQGDLDWIVMKCLEKDRTRRYETANGVAADLQRHLNNEPVVARPPTNLYRFQKLVRRNKLAFAATSAVATALVLGMVVSTWQAVRATRAEHFAESARVAEVEQRAEAEGQRANAEANFQKARATVDEYFTTISETALLEAPGLQPLRKQLLEAALVYYQGFLDQARDNPELQADLAAAHLRLSVIYVSLDRNDDAVAAMLRGLELVEQLIQKRPEDAALPRRLAGFFKISGNFFEKTKPPADPIKAVNTLQRAAGIWEQFARDNPTTLEFQGDLAGIYLLLGALFQEGNDFDHSLAQALQSRAILEKLVRARPAAAAYQALLVNGYDLSSYGLKRQNQPQEGEKLRRQAVRYFENLAREFPAELNVRRSQAQVYLQLADALPSTQRAEAEGIYRQALGLLENLVAESPMNAHYRRELYACYNHLTGLLRNAGRNEEADELASRALPINEQLVVEFPSTPDYRLDLGKRYLVLAEQMKESRPLEAETAYRRALTIHEKLVADFPGQERFMTELAKCQQQLISLLRNTGNSEEPVEQLYRQAIVRGEKLVTANPSVPEYWQQLARDHNQLGIFLRNDGRKEEAEVELRKAQELWRARSGPELERLKKAAESDPKNGVRWGDLAIAYSRFGNWEASLEIFKTKEHLGYGIAGSAWEWFNIAMAHWQLDNQAEARDWFYKSIGWMDDVQENRLRERQAEAAALLGLPDPWDRSGKASTYFKQGNAFEQQGEMEKAKAAYGQVISVYESLLADFPMVPAYRKKLVDLLNKTGRQQEAEKVSRQTESVIRDELARRRKLLGNEDPDVATLLSDLSFQLREEGKLSEAETTAREALTIRRKMLGNEHTDVAQSLHLLAWNLKLQGKQAEAETLSREEVAMWRKLLGNEHPNVGWALGDLTVFLSDQGKLAEAETLWREELASRKKNFGEVHRSVEESLAALAKVLQQEGKLAEAEAVWREELAMERKLSGDEHPFVAASLRWLASVLAELTEKLLVQQKFTDAERPARECVIIREKQISDDWRTFNARSLLGGSLLGQKKYSEAEPLLLSGYEGMKQREDKIPANGKVRLQASIQRLEELYAATSQSEKAAEWKRKLTEFDQNGTDNKPAALSP